MVFGWRRRRRTSAGRKKQQGGCDGDDHQLVIPNHFLCPISLDLMKDPVTLSSGITYDRENIDAWLESGKFTCPVANQILTSFDQIPNHSLRMMIQDWCVENRNHGVERIPTPRIPVSSFQVSEILSAIIDSSTKRLDQHHCVELVKKINELINESDRNRRCIASNGASGVLAAAFDAFAMDSYERNSHVMAEILSATTCLMISSRSLDVESQIYLGSSQSLRSLIWFLKHSNDLSTKRNSITVLKELLSSDEQHGEALAAIEGVEQVLFSFIKHPLCPTITKSSLLVIYHLLSSRSPSSSAQDIKSKFVKMGMVSLLIETIIESERSICERALGVFDKLCDCEEGREEAYGNALTWPVLVKKILRVSELATDFSVSIIWKLNKYGRNNNYEQKSLLVEALQVGAFQKLVLLLQVGCGDDTKEKATELLKLMNPYRNESECIESVDFKNLKRSF